MTTLRLRGLGLNPRRRATPGAGPPGDTEAPSVPQNLAATAVSSSQIDLTWDASTDNVGVTGYNIYRDNVPVDTNPTNSYADTGLDPSTEYQYEVSAFDAASNESARSAPASATTHYVATPVNFDGSTWLRRDAELTGAADSKVFSGSVWARRGVTDTFMRLFNAVSDKQQLAFFNNGVGNRVAVVAKNAGGTIIFEVRTTNNDTLWHHYLWSVDLASASLRHFYVDDVATGTWQTYTDDTIDFTSGGFGIGNTPTGSSNGPWTGDMADIWLRFGGAVIDFSVEANRRMFITADGKPADPASWPTGGIVQLHGAVAEWHTNKGSGGGFNLTGTLAAGTGPVAVP